MEKPAKSNFRLSYMIPDRNDHHISLFVAIGDKSRGIRAETELRKHVHTASLNTEFD